MTSVLELKDQRRQYKQPTIDYLNAIEDDSEPEESVKYFKPTKSDYYDPFSFQSTQRSPTIEKYLKYKGSQRNGQFSNRLDSRISVQVGNVVFDELNKSQSI